MKKEILINSEYEYKVKYVISKNKYAIYIINKNKVRKDLSFYKNNMDHRPCNIGPQNKGKHVVIYRENDKSHNLYGYSYISKLLNSKQYWINNIMYKEYQFNKYISLYNSLKYRRKY